MTTPVISAQSKEYIRVPVSARDSGAVVDPSALTVNLAFVTTDPTSGDWKAATWETDTTTSPTSYFARAVVGPGGVITLTAGTTYQVWVKVTGSPEIPIKLAGYLKVI